MNEPICFMKAGGEKTLRLFTIGHSNYAFKEFLSLLKVYEIGLVAVYDEDTANYDWGWTNHRHGDYGDANDDAVAGVLFINDGPEWIWEELYDQTGMSEDMSFILFTSCPCKGDINNDGYVSFSDFSDLVNKLIACGWFCMPGQPCWDECCDFNEDGYMSFSDASDLVNYLIANGWFIICP